MKEQVRSGAGLAGPGPGRCRDWHGVIYTAGILLLVCCLLPGCVTLRPVDTDAVTLHREIRTGDLVKPGDTIRVITVDGVAQKLKVITVDEHAIRGRPPYTAQETAITQIPIDAIVRMEIGEWSGEKAGTFAKETGKGGLWTLVAILVAALVGVLASG